MGTQPRRWPGLVRGRQPWPVVATTMGAVLATFGSVLALRALMDVSAGAVVLAVVLALTLGRVGQRQPDHLRVSRHAWLRAVRHPRLLTIVLPPAVALLASEIATLATRHRAAGEALFTVALGGAVWLRRFGPVATRIGTLVTLPFLALLITPVPPDTRGLSRFVLVTVALIATAWTTLAGVLATRLGPGPPAIAATAPPPLPAPRAAPVRPAVSALAADASRGDTSPMRSATAEMRTGRPSRRRLPASTRMAAQLAVALGVAFALGRVLFPEHRTWLVLTAYLVNSGNRGRGDVVLRSGQRLVGAALGTAAASLLAGQLPSHNPWSIVAIFGLLTLGTWLRTASYAWWAACVTGVLALLYGYDGQGGAEMLRERLLAVGLGAALGLAAAWFVLPVRTEDVLRRRVADVLAALTDYLVVAQTGRRRGAARPAGRGPDPTDLRLALADAHARVEATLDRLAEIAPTLRAHRTFDRLRLRLCVRFRRRPGPGRRPDHHAPHRYDGVEALLAARPALDALTHELDRRGSPPSRAAGREIARVRDTIVEFRRALGRAGAATPTTLAQAPVLQQGQQFRPV
ncbi:FUSC family protein [Frankia sp. R82]|uniref:FUSC family protein n=1 Tax=Frankia sp. R82 TaxID=2950553 RepID=UPI00204475B9|nr:FUSC family protein [Frankia sp. R82]MCM3886562.1 FUSC family protein [Frankia sp. R82]